jgi:seryl-tRNA synthetase
VTSTSNCTTFQARRLNVRMREAEGVRPVATLNGTLVAIPRVIVAILENFQQADGSVVVPEALRATVGSNVLNPA